jgi:DNA repair protein RecO
MAGETQKTTGLVLDIRPWSRTSHIVTWLVPEKGPIATLVKGAVRPKSAFLGQYDFFYTCELIYYVRAKGELHAIREASPIECREFLRGRFRAAALASYACYLIKEHCPHSSEASVWYNFLERFLDRLDGNLDFELKMISLETAVLSLAGLSPDFTEADFSAETIPFSIDLGRAGSGAKTVQLSSGAAKLIALGGKCADGNVNSSDKRDAIRFLGLFTRYHIDMPPDIRRNTLLLGTTQMPGKNQNCRIQN